MLRCPVTVMKHDHAPLRRLGKLALPGLFLVILCSCRQPAPTALAKTPHLTARQIAVLNGLRDEINSVYGFENGRPRINRGPCGRFAKAFFEQWNSRFPEKVTIAFVMMPDARDGVGCDHVLIKLPDGSYFDGGGGIMSTATLLQLFSPDDRIEDTVDFDLALLDKRSYGLNRSYRLCPNYSDEVTARIIEKHLALLPPD